MKNLWWYFQFDVTMFVYPFFGKIFYEQGLIGIGNNMFDSTSQYCNISTVINMFLKSLRQPAERFGGLLKAL